MRKELKPEVLNEKYFVMYDVPLVLIIALLFCVLVSQILAVLSPLAVASRSGFVACQHN